MYVPRTPITSCSCDIVQVEAGFVWIDQRKIFSRWLIQSRIVLPGPESDRGQRFHKRCCLVLNWSSHYVCLFAPRWSPLDLSRSLHKFTLLRPGATFSFIAIALMARAAPSIQIRASMTTWSFLRLRTIFSANYHAGTVLMNELSKRIKVEKCIGIAIRD